MSHNNLALIAQVCEVEVKSITNLIEKINPPIKKMVAVEVAIIRLAIVQEWLEAFNCKIWTKAEKLLLEKILGKSKEWRPLVRRATIKNSDNRSLCYGQVEKHPVYASLCDMGDESEVERESLAMPFLALFIIGYIRLDKSRFDTKSIGRIVRRLFNMGDHLTKKLKAEFPNKSVIINDRDNLIEIASKINDLEWVARVVSDIGFGILKPRQNNGEDDYYELRPPNRPIKKSVPSTLHVNYYRDNQRNSWIGEEVDIEGMATTEFGGQIAFLFGEQQDECDVRLQARKAANFTVMENQYLIWRHNHLNFHEVARVKGELEKLRQRL